MPVTIDTRPVTPALFGMINQAQLPAVRGRAIATVVDRVLAEMNARNLAALGTAITVKVVVDGVIGAPVARAQRRVRLETQLWPVVLGFAKDFAEERSPVDSGDYRRAWHVLVNGDRVDEADFDRIPDSAVVVFTNDRPYSRKIEIGAMKMSVPPHVAAATGQAVSRKFAGLVQTRQKYVELDDGYVMRAGKNRGEEMRYPAVEMRLV